MRVNPIDSGVSDEDLREELVRARGDLATKILFGELRP